MSCTYRFYVRTRRSIHIKPLEHSSSSEAELTVTSNGRLFITYVVYLSVICLGSQPKRLLEVKHMKIRIPTTGECTDFDQQFTPAESKYASYAHPPLHCTSKDCAVKELRLSNNHYEDAHSE